jgi:hypothetical protein
LARTYRDRLKVERREHWALADELPVGAFPDQFPGAPDIRNWQRTKGGDMVMSPSTSGVWDDMRANDSDNRKRQRRMHKRRERASWKREVTTAG